MPEQIDERAQKAIAERVFPGCAIGILSGGKREVRAYGSLAYDRRAVREETVYDLASVTKSIPVASLALDLVAEGTMRIDSKVAGYLPEMANHRGATIEDLLRYRVRGARLSSLAARVRTFEEIRTHVLESGFDGPPAESAYTNLPAFVLGLIIERITGESIAALSHRRYFEPLGMRSTTFFPSADDCAPTEVDARGEVRGLPHDESAYLFAKARRTAGHAGLFSTVGDLLTFLEALMDGTLPHVIDGAQRGLGWSSGDSFFMGSHARDTTFGKTGFTGTSFVCDIDRRTGIVILSNRTFPRRPADANSPTSAMNLFRRDIADIALGA